MKNIDQYVKGVGERTHIRISSELIESMNNSRFDATRVLRDQFYNYNYILNRFDKVIVDSINIVGYGDSRRCVFNGYKYIDRIFRYYGMFYDRLDTVDDNMRMFRGVYSDLENASTFADIAKISPSLGVSFANHIYSYISNNNEGNIRKSKFLATNLKLYIEGLESLDSELEEIIDKLIVGFKNRELDRMDQFSLDIMDNFRSLVSVPNSYVSNILEHDMSLVIAYLVLNDEDLCERDDIKNFVSKFISDNAYKVISGYSIDFMLDGKMVNVSMSDILKKYKSIYKTDIKLEVEEVVEEREIPKFDSEYLKTMLLDGENLVKLSTPMFSEVSDEQFLRDVIPRKESNYERHVDDIALLQSKVDLYQLIDKETIYMGENAYEGYFAFEVKNGYIILDKFFSNIDKKEISVSDAVYVVHKDDFDKFLRMSKTESFRAIKDGRINGYRWYHTSGWQDKVLDIATMELDEARKQVL